MIEQEWLAKYGDTMRWAQKFEDSLLGLLLTVRDYRDAQRAAADFEKLLKGDFRSPAGGLLERLFDDEALLERVVKDAFGAHWAPAAIKREFKAAVDARNDLAHYYFRNHQFLAEKGDALVAELESLDFLLVFAKKTAESLQHQLSPGRNFRDNPAIFRREIETLLGKSDELEKLARMADDIRDILSRPLPR